MLILVLIYSLFGMLLRVRSMFAVHATACLSVRVLPKGSLVLDQTVKGLLTWLLVR